MLQNLSYIGVIIAGVYVIEAGHLTMGGLIACSILSSRVLNSTSQITRLLLQWHHARHSLQVLDKVLSYPTDDDPSRQAHTHVAPLDQIGRATSELQSLMRNSYAVFCLKKKNNNIRSQLLTPYNTLNTYT